MLTVLGPVAPGALTAREWGFYDASFNGSPFRLQRPYGSYVMENILFKISFPAEFHAQTAVECALALHERVRDRLDQVSRIVLATQESAIRIISKTGPLHNPADRDHCLQYMVASALVRGGLTAEDYSDEAAADPRIDLLRSLMEVEEDPRYSRDYLDPDRRSIGNSVQVFFNDGSDTGKVEVEYPLGHRRRRKEGIPLLMKKCRDNLSSRLTEEQVADVLALSSDSGRLLALPVDQFIGLFLPRG